MLETENLDRKILYKLAMLKKKYNENEEKQYNDYLEMRMERLLIKTIKEEKIKKAYHVTPTQNKHEPDRLLMF